MGDDVPITNRHADDEAPTTELSPETRPLAASPPGSGNGHTEGVPPPARLRGDDARIDPVQAMPRIEGYRLIRLLGQGGMGSVFEAEQENPRRRVAIKVVRGGGTGRSELRRFRQEAHILGALNHPGLARVYEAGTFQSHEEELPYYAMEYLEGETLLAHARTHDLGPRARLELLRDICMAVGHAHASGVIHRDLKPGNILVDPSGRPKVLDFGLARSAGLALEDGGATLTETGNLVGTFLYMSPEQVAGRRDLDARSDVFALGTIAYELLTGRHPFKREDSSLHDVLRAIQEEDPTPLSATERHLRGDIETIVHKAMERDRHRRYANASDMAEDIERFLHDEPIVARAPSAVYQLSKFARRNRALVGGVAAVIATLAIGLVLTAWQASVAIRNARLAKASAALAESEQYLAAIRSADALIANGRHSLAEDTLLRTPPALRGWEWGRLARMARPEALRIRFNLASDPDPSVAELDPRVAFARAGRLLVAGPIPEGIGLWNLDSGEPAPPLGPPPVAPLYFKLDPASELCALWEDGTPRRELHNLATGARSQVTSFEYSSLMAFSPDGSILSFSSPSGPGSILESRRTSDLALRWTTPVEGSGFLIAVSASGDRICVLVNGFDAPRFSRLECRSGADGSLRFRSGDYGEFMKAAEFSPDGRYLVTGGAARFVHVYDATFRPEPGAPAPEVAPLFEVSRHEGIVTCIAWSPDSTRFYSADNQGMVIGWDPETRDAVFVVKPHRGSIDSLSFDPRSDLLLTGSSDRTLCLIDAETGRLERRLEGHDSYVSDGRFDPSGDRFASASYDGTVRIWASRHDVATPDLDAHRRPIDGIDIDARGDRILTISFEEAAEGEGDWEKDRTAVLWNARTGTREGVFLDAGGGAALSPDGSRVAVADRRGSLVMHDADDGRELARTSGYPTHHSPPLFSPGGKWIAGGHRTLETGGTTLRVWRAEDLSLAYEEDPTPGGLTSIAFAPDDSRLYRTCHQAELSVVDIRTRPPGAKVIAGFHPDGVIAVCPRTGRIALGDTTGKLRLLAPDGEPLLDRPFAPNERRGNSALAFSPDGALLAIACSDMEIRILDAGTLADRGALRGCVSPIRTLCFDPPGTRLLSSEAHGFVKLWDVASARELLNLEEMRLARFHPEGRTVVAAGDGPEEHARKAYLLTSFPWDAPARTPADMEAAQRADYLRSLDAARAPSWIPRPRPNAGPPLFEDDFETTASLQRWTMAKEGEWSLDGEAVCRTERAGLFAASSLQVRADLPERYAFEVDVRLPPAGSSDKSLSESPVGGRALFLLNGEWKPGPPLPEGDLFGIFRFHVRGLRPDKPMFVTDGRRWVFARFPGDIRESVMDQPSADTSLEPLREVWWRPRRTFRVRAEVEPERYRVFLDGEHLYDRAIAPGPTSPPALLHYLDSIPSAAYDRVAVYPLAPDDAG